MAFASHQLTLAVTAQRGENVLRQGSRKLSTASISNAGRINISFAICLHIRNVTPSNAAAKAIRRRPHPVPRDMPEDGAGAGERESSQDENNSVDRKNLPSSFVSPLPPSILPSSRSPSLFATRYDDHDNKMCGEGGGGSGGGGGGAILR